MNLTNSIGAAKLKVEKLFSIFLDFRNKEDEALRKILKSDLTTEISETDAKRDMIFRGMVDTNKAALNHFKPAVHLAARRMQIVFDTYGNVTKKAVDAETSAIYNLLKELSEKHEADMETVGLNPWYEELHTQNGAVEKLLENRNVEVFERGSLVLRKVRGEVDEAYRNLTLCVEAFSLTETGETSAACEEFIGKLNVLIERTNNIVAIRKGRAAAKKKEEEQKPTKPAEPPTGGE